MNTIKKRKINLLTDNKEKQKVKSEIIYQKQEEEQQQQQQQLSIEQPLLQLLPQLSLFQPLKPLQPLQPLQSFQKSSLQQQQQQQQSLRQQQQPLKQSQKQQQPLKQSQKQQQQQQQPFQQLSLSQLKDILKIIKSLHVKDVNTINDEIIKRKYQLMMEEKQIVSVIKENQIMINSYGYRTILHCINPNVNDNTLYKQSKAFDTEFTKKKDGDNNISCYQLNKFKNNTDTIKIYDIKNDAMTYGKYMEDPIRNQFLEAGFLLFASSKIFSVEGYSSHPDGEFRQALCECQECECALEIKCTYNYTTKESPSAIYTKDNIYQMLSHLKHKKCHLCIYFHYFKLTGNHILSIVVDHNYATWNSIIYNTIDDSNKVLKENIKPIYHFDRKYDRITFLTEQDEWKKYFCTPYNDESFWSIFTTYFK